MMARAIACLEIIEMLKLFTLTDMYNDVDLIFGESEIQASPIKSKYESIKRRISNTNLSIPSFDV